MSRTTANTPDTVQAAQVHQFVRWLLPALIISTLLAVGSLVADIASFSSHTDHSGTVSTVIHHTTASRIVVSMATLFHLYLIVGLLRRAPSARRAASTLPVVWALVAAVASWPQLAGPSPDWTVAIPVTIIMGTGIWQTIAWRRSLAL